MKSPGARSLLTAFLLAFAAQGGPLSADGSVGLPQGAYLLPPRFRPGEIVELRMSLDPGERSEKRELLPPNRSEEYEIKKVLLETGPKGSTLSLFFISWKPGRLDLAPFKAEGVEFPGATVQVESILSGDAERARPLRGYLLLPGTRTMVAMAISGLAALVLAAWAVAAFILPFASRLLSVRRARKPYKRFQHQTRIMRKRMGDGDGAYFYALLSKAFRVYVAARLSNGFASVTAGEMERAGGAGEGMPDFGADRGQVARVLLRADLVRFADRPSDFEERASDMAALSRVVDSLEAERAGA